MARKPCLYVNTSIVIRAMNPKEPGHSKARRLLEECCSKCKCVYSSVHAYEMPSRRFMEITEFLQRRRVEYVDLDTGLLESRAVEIVMVKKLSERRVPDIMHLLAAQRLGCKYILARDRFLWRNSKYFKLTYVNWETHGGKCPCSRRSHSASGQAETSGNGGKSSVNSLSSPTKPETHLKQGKSSNNTRKAISPSGKQRGSSRNSRRHGRKASRHKGKPGSRGPQSGG